MREKKLVRFQESFYTTQSIVNDLIDVVLTCSGQAYGLDLRMVAPKLQSVGAQRKHPCTDIGIGSANDEVLFDLPRKLFNEMKNWHFYGLHYCLSSVKKGQMHYLMLCPRCLKYGMPWKCKTSTFGRLFADKKTWRMKYNPIRNRECSVLTEADVRKRVETVCSSSVFEVCQDDREQLRQIFAVPHDRGTDSCQTSSSTMTGEAVKYLK